MRGKPCHSRDFRYGLFAASRTAIVAAVFSAIGASPSSAYIGPSFLEVPGIAGGWLGGTYKDSVKIESSYWEKNPPRARPPSADRKSTFFSGPAAPRQGPGLLMIAVDKHNPGLAPLMDECVKKKKIAELTYAESSDLARPPSEFGPRPSDIPEYFEYKLKDVQLSCPVVADAPEQAFVLNFSDIQRLNYQGDGKDVTPEPAKLPPAQSSGVTKAFVVTWFSGATDISNDQCPVVNSKPKEDDYYALMSKEDAAKERAALASTGGIFAKSISGLPSFRGPNKLSVCWLPGIVRDPGHAAPQSKVARGFNLDGDEGAGDPPATTGKHKNYLSEDGRTGIDNQLYGVDGCIAGFKRNGLLTMARNETRRSGQRSTLVEISGIDDEQNDDSIDVTVLYSDDPVAKNASGSQVLQDYTFRVSNKAELTQHFIRAHGRIVNGVVVTEPMKEMFISDGQRLILVDARMRLEFLPDGTMKGVVGGYQDWRYLMNFWAAYSSGFETFMGFQCPGVYNAFKRAADGLKDPVTGEFNGISSAYDIEGVPAFIPPTQQKALMAQTEGRGQ